LKNNKKYYSDVLYDLIINEILIGLRPVRKKIGCFSPEAVTISL